ncbi:MAG: hypothetical protein P4L44_05520 [Oryzomonas sp.]|uniref:hypothetical protein n=1 Tax=Oryzomonas sp. TaxID=2855186 RepID=UPI00284F5AC7|nr:hypothetical protein [Oryzomonas sp.]MDR3579398.1 hypothetical protein [Oryzomonas sp.]
MDIPHIGKNAALAGNAVPLFPFLTAAGLAGNYFRSQLFLTVRPALQAGSAAQHPTGGGNA